MQKFQVPYILPYFPCLIVNNKNKENVLVQIFDPPYSHSQSGFGVLIFLNNHLVQLSLLSFSHSPWELWNETVMCFMQNASAPLAGYFHLLYSLLVCITVLILDEILLADFSPFFLHEVR